MQVLRRAFEHPLSAGLDVDDPLLVGRRREILLRKPFLRQIYDEWYERIRAALPPAAAGGGVLELGSGAGYFREFLPEAFTSEVFWCPNVSLVADAQQLPVADGALRAITMTDTLHHLPEVRRFFREAVRCLRPGGRIVMVEPWVTWWSRRIYRNLHHEPFEPEAATWEFPPAGPLSGANGALPWIIFVRDRRIFESEFPELTLRAVEPFMPLRYLVSGGISLRSLAPAATFSWWRHLEKGLNEKAWAMFAFLVVERR